MYLQLLERFFITHTWGFIKFYAVLPRFISEENFTFPDTGQPSNNEQNKTKEYIVSYVHVKHWD